MSELVLLDDSYQGVQNAPNFHVGNRTLLRRVDPHNYFLADPVLKGFLEKMNVVPYAINLYDNQNFIEISPFFFPNSAANWSYSMYQNCVNSILELNTQLNSLGYCLVDGHCFNTVFFYTQPVFVDLGSIIPGTANDGIKELKSYRKALLSYRVTSAARTRSRLDSEIEAPRYTDVIRDLICPDHFVSWRGRLARLVGYQGVSRWRHYYSANPDEYCDQPKEEVVRRILEDIKPKTVYDVGCNTGHYAYIAESLGADVVACDPDPDCVDYLYRAIKGKGRRILPLVADLDDLLRAIERTYSNLRPRHVDTVMMLALVHHLVYRVGYSFEDIFDRVRKLGAGSLIIEFVNKKDANVTEWDNKSSKPWYGLEQLCTVGERYFRRCEVHRFHDDERPIVVFSERTDV
ncbi:MAG: class I SAM-dependent methyltransferase [Desulfuromonadaceae bacterium]|nr:class I SAM-dependent methyltransferase [Desulfuromonadaceae bacterium]